MDCNDPVPWMEQETLPDLPPPHKVSIACELAPHSTREDALDSASAIPLPPSSPASIPQLTPRLRMDVSAPQAQSPSQKLPTSRPLNCDRRLPTPPQASRRSSTNPVISSNTPSQPATIRRISSNFLRVSSASTTRSRSSSEATIRDMEHNPAITAARLAHDYFKKELAVHGSAETPSKVVVIIRDSCYGHRYSRPRTSKAALNTIVERPERLHACILGASTAYVRIGSRHAGGNFPPHPDRDVPPPPFRIRKTTRSTPLNHSAVTQVHGQKWMEELQLMCDSAEGKLAMNGRELGRPTGRGRDEAGKPLPKLHEGDLYLCSESLAALQGCLGGVCEAVDTVFGPGNTSRAFVCIRPPGHHCSSNLPSGFCWLNNVHVGIAHGALSQGLTHAAILDFDLHHGDGSQAIAWDHNRKAAGNLPKNASLYSKTPIGYFSLHDINSYPCEWGDEETIKNASLCIESAHGQSIWNVHLEPWKNHTDFWKLYESRYSILLEKTRTFLQQHTTRLEGAKNGIKAKAAIFLSAGFDASEWEGAGMQRHKVNVPTDFYARFTSDVVKLADEEGLGVDGRIISVLEGGYSDRALASGVLSHLCGLTQDAVRASFDSGLEGTGLASAMSRKMSTLNTTSQDGPINGKTSAIEHLSGTENSYDPDWWATPNLEALEALTSPAPAHSAHTKPKDKTPGNYSSPTQASTAKMTDPGRERRSPSGQAENRASAEPEPGQPPPDVDWAVASFELSRLLIPGDRQTLSCRHDELSAEATKVRQGRQAAIALPSNVLSAADQGMQLRDRKAKAPVAEELIGGTSKPDRRRTIAAVGDLPDTSSLQNSGNRPAVGIANSRPRRRSSAGSSILSAFESMNLNDRGSQHLKSGIANDRGESQEKARISTLPAKLDKAPIQRRAKEPTASKAQPTRAKTSPKKTGHVPPVPKVPSAFTSSFSHASNGEQGGTTHQAQSASDSTDSATSATRMVDSDALASRMRKLKINLKVPSPEENAARERKAAEEKEKQKRGRAPRKPTVPKAAKVAQPKGTRRPNTLGARGAAGISTTENENATPSDFNLSTTLPKQPLQSIQSTEEPASANDYVPAADIAHAEPPLGASIPAPVPTLMGMDTLSIDRSVKDVHDTSGKLAHPSITTTEPVISSPPLPPHPQPNDLSQPSYPIASAPASATSKKTRADLPQFTASSPIPFSKTNANSRPSPQPANKENDVPTLADSTFQAATADSDTHPDSQQRRLSGNAVANNHPVQQPPSVSSAASIWEVPETPRH